MTRRTTNDDLAPFERQLSRVWRGLGNGMPTACPWEFHVRRYTGGHPQPITPFPSGGFAAAGERGGEG
jgi:hypothetical protein